MASVISLYMRPVWRLHLVYLALGLLMNIHVQSVCVYVHFDQLNKQCHTVFMYLIYCATRLISVSHITTVIAQVYTH